jgi:hypothetical protein
MLAFGLMSFLRRRKLTNQAPSLTGRVSFFESRWMTRPGQAQFGWSASAQFYWPRGITRRPDEQLSKGDSSSYEAVPTKRSTAYVFNECSAGYVVTAGGLSNQTRGPRRTPLTLWQRKVEGFSTSW